MTGGVTVLTPTIRGRETLLEECKASVSAQSVAVAAHRIYLDANREGFAAALNNLWPQAETRWVGLIADDDLWDVDYLEHLLDYADAHPGGDVYYCWCRVEGRGYYNPNKPYDGNFADVPVSGIFSRDLIAGLGGWRDVALGNGGPDIDFLRRAQALNASFHCTEQVKWTWRFHGDNWSLGGARGEG